MFFGFAGAKVRTFIGTAKYFDYFFEIIFKKEEHLPKGSALTIIIDVRVRVIL